MVVLTVAERSFLVIFGGASPEHGPLGDVCYAELPVISNPIGKTSTVSYLACS